MSCNVKIRLEKDDKVIVCFNLEIDYDGPNPLDPDSDEEIEIIDILDDILSLDQDIFFEVDDWVYLEDRHWSSEYGKFLTTEELEAEV